MTSRPTRATIANRALMRRATDTVRATAMPRVESPAMKAIVVREHGGVEKLEKAELPDPVPQPGEAIVAVRAAALNHLDIWLRRGVPGHKFPLPMIPGAEVTGVIGEIADGHGWKGGDAGIVGPGYSCGLCPACLSGNDPLCQQYGMFGETRNGGCAGKI